MPVEMEIVSVADVEGFLCNVGIGEETK